MKTILLIIICMVNFTILAGDGGTIGGGPRLKSLLSNNFNFATSEIKFNAEKISNIQLSNGAFISPNKAAKISKDVRIIFGNILINKGSREIFDVQMKDGRTCVIRDTNCY